MAKMMPSDDSIQADIDRYMLAVPHALRNKPYWLLWRFEAAQKPGDKPRKVPYYVNGTRRQGIQGAAEDLAQLVTFDQAIETLRAGHWSGIGFAHVPGCGVISLDFDRCVHEHVIAPEIEWFCKHSGSYTELSPSGTGVRHVVLGTMASVKAIHEDGYNVEVFGETGFVTITGHNLYGDTVEPLREDLVPILKEWLQDDGKSRRRTEQLDQIKALDPVYQRLRSTHKIKHEFHDGRIGIVCPFEAEHTTGNGVSDTIYFPPHTLGYPKGHFHCLHAHCARRTDQEFAHAIGVASIRFDEDGSPVIPLSTFTNAWKSTEYVVKGILQRGHLVALTGHSNAGKTAIALRFAFNIARGTPIGNHPTRRGKVVYLAGENADDIRCRLIALCQQAHLDPTELDEWLHIVPLAFPLAEHVSALKAELAQLGDIVLIVIDTRAAYASAEDENDNMQALIDARCNRELMDLPSRPACMPLNHPPHRADTENLKPRGGSAYLAELDANLTAWNDGSGNITLAHNKIRGTPFDPLVLELVRFTLLGYLQPDGDPVETIVANPIDDDRAQQMEHKARSDEDNLLLAMRASPKHSISQWASTIGLPKTTTYRMLKRLREERLVKLYRRSWMLTDKGKAEAEMAQTCI